MTTIVERNARVLGRELDCDVVLPGREVSRRHAKLWHQGEQALLRDLDSRNGSFLNGTRFDEAQLTPSDVVRIGECVGVVVRQAPSVSMAFGAVAPEWYGGFALREVAEPARRIAPTNLPVVIQGETGTGKDGLARAIHQWSSRSGGLVAVNCAAIPPALAEAELFGYRKGAFTGAAASALGFFRAADAGTLFLDEVLELPLSVQAKLLRALEGQEVTPLGEAWPSKVDVRVVAASQEPLSVAVERGQFRADLMARLDGLTVVLPPLRERREDVVPLFMAFATQGGVLRAPELEPRFVEQLLFYDWPLNVRELCVLTRRLLALHSGEPRLRRSFLPERVREASLDGQVTGRQSRTSSRDDESFELFLQALREHDGNVARAARALGISRARAYRLIDARPGFELNGLRPESGR